MNTSTKSRSERAIDKLSKIKIESSEKILRKPDWIRVQLPNNQHAAKVKKLLKNNQLKTVCEEAACPNMGECFNCGTATFMIMGSICTRRCAFCNVEHGKPLPLDQTEPQKLAQTVKSLNLSYVVVTSVDRDDLKDGGASHFAACTKALREIAPDVKVEILTPDFRSRLSIALDALSVSLPDVFNHNIETVPRLYKTARFGADFNWSLSVLKQFKERFPHVPTKSGLMVGLGERDEEIIEVLHALREHDVTMLTIGQYLQPTRHHMPVDRYVTPKQFVDYARIAKTLGFEKVASGPLVRSSYHAEEQTAGEAVQ